MSDPNALVAELERSLKRTKAAAVASSLNSVIPPEPQWRPPSTPAKKAKAPMVRWKRRDSDGNVIPARPGSTRNQAGPSRKAHPGGKKPVPDNDVPDTISEVSFAADAVERFIQELQHSLSVVSASIEQAPTPTAPLQASSDWSTRNHSLLERWLTERPRLINSVAARADVGTHMCQQCALSPAAVCCHGCEPRPFLCPECDIKTHTDTRNVMHNRDAMTAGFFQPLPPTTCIVDKVHCRCERFVPVRIPESICCCAKEALRVNPGKAVAVITMDGRYDLSMPDLRCESCQASWTAEVNDLIRSNYWPATLQFATVYAQDIFFSFEKIKMASPGMSCQAFLKMLDQRTVHFGRTGKIHADAFQKSYFQWAAVQYEVEKLCKEKPLVCPACTPEMVAISVDGNRKHYRFKSASRSEEKPIFDGVFIARDEDVTRFVDYIHQSTNHVPGRGVCGGQWTAAREVSSRSSSNIDEHGLEIAACRHGLLLGALNMFRGEIFAYPLYLQKQLADRQIKFFCMDVACKYWPYLQRVAEKCPELNHLLHMKPFLSIFHAKAHDFKCEVKWSGNHLDGAGLTLGEEVEQCNAFLSRIAVTTKHMSKAGRTDMLSLMAIHWNQQKVDALTTSLSRRYQKAVKGLQSQLQNLEALKVEFAVAESQLEDWAKDVQKWAEAATTTADEPDCPDALSNKIEMLVLGIKRRSQRLQKDTDGSKARARILRKIRKEKEILGSVVEQYNRMVPGTEALVMETILSVETAWPWQLQDSGSVDLRKKRRAFDIIMSVRRLTEEKKILVTEMEHHWKSLSVYAQDLKELSCSVSSGTLINSPWDLSEEGVKGLQCILLSKQWNLRKVMTQSRERYLLVLTGAENVSFLDNAPDADDDYQSDSDLSEDDLE